MNEMSRLAPEAAEKPVLIPVEAYLSEDYAKAENEKLWAKVWQVACREEELPNVGDYVTYDIQNDSIIVVRSGPDTIRAFHNVCQHRGRQLTDGCGHAAHFQCRFHGWRWDLDGKNTFIHDPEDFSGTLTPENTRLAAVQCDTWGGWVWINMDLEAGPLSDFLSPAPAMLKGFEIEKMRYRWRRWMKLDVNWKTALEAFNESVHSDYAHFQIKRWGSNYFWCKAENNSAWHGSAGLRDPSGKKLEPGATGGWTLNSRELADPRVMLRELQNEMVRDLDATTTQSVVDAANRLVDELPEGVTLDQAMTHMMTQAITADAARGVEWPRIEMSTIAATGHDWHIFPNTIFLQSPTTLLGYRARPDGFNPDSCILEIYVIERFPEGQAPETKWEHVPAEDVTTWRRTLCQDFVNLPHVQKGMKSSGFRGPRPSPVQELSIIHFHRFLSQYMGTGAPVPVS